MVNIILTTILALCGIGLVVSFGILSIIALSKYSKLFLKIYLYIFEHSDYKVYKEVKQLLKNGEIIPVCSRFTDAKTMNGYYFMVFDNKEVSLWKDDKPVLVYFHQKVIDEFIKIGHLQWSINTIWEGDNKYMKELNERIAQLEKEIAKEKAKLEELNEQ